MLKIFENFDFSRVGQVQSLLEAHGIGLAELVTHHATLEDVFISLTGRHLRDE